MIRCPIWLPQDRFTTGGANEFKATFGGDTLLDLVNAGPFSYTQETFSNVLATGSTTTLEFQGYQDIDLYALDDVSVTFVGMATPKPGAFALVAGLGLTGAVVMRRKRAC